MMNLNETTCLEIYSLKVDQMNHSEFLGYIKKSLDEVIKVYIILR